MMYELKDSEDLAEYLEKIGDSAMGEDREKWIYGLPRDHFVQKMHMAAKLLRSQTEEIDFLKGMQRQLTVGLDNEKLGEMVFNAMKGGKL